MTIIHTDYNDDGIYSFVGKYDRSSEFFCTVALVTVTVNTLPVCNTFLISENEVVKLSCKWVPRSYGDKMQLMTKGQLLQLYEYEKRMRGADTDSTWNTKTVISAMIATKDLIDGRIPDKCIVYNPENNFENQCTFSLFMHASVSEINEYGQEAVFSCCSESKDATRIWLYDKGTNLTIQSFTRVDGNTFSKSSNIGQTSIVLICGKEKNDRLVLYGIGELILNLANHRGVILTGQIEPDEPYSAPSRKEIITCAHTYTIRVRVSPLGKDITSNTDAGSSSTVDINTRQLQTKNYNLKTWNSILVTAFVISLCFNIAVCVAKSCKNTKVSAFKKTSTSNRIRNTTSLNQQVSTSSNNTIGNETIQMPSMSSSLRHLGEQRTAIHTEIDKTVCPHNFSSSRKNERRSKLSGGWKEESTVPQREVCSESLAASCHQKNKLRHDVLPGKDDSSLEIYQTIDESMPPPVLYHTLEENKSSSVIYQTLNEDKSSPLLP